MTQGDWDNLISQWEDSFTLGIQWGDNAFGLANNMSEGEFKKQYLQEPYVKSKDTYVKEHIGRLGHGTPKAKFYLTQSSMSGDFGFWCPKAAIVSESKTQVEIANWCNIKVIEYNRY